MRDGDGAGLAGADEDDADDDADEDGAAEDDAVEDCAGALLGAVGVPVGAPLPPAPDAGAPETGAEPLPAGAAGRLDDVEL